MITTNQEAIAYLRPIADSASLPNYQRALRLALDALDRLDTVDDPVHHAGGCYCRECEKFDPDEIVATHMGTCWHSNMVKRFDDFCSNGRRKDDLK